MVDSCIVQQIDHTSNGICEDGYPSANPNVLNSETAICNYGQDDADCGYRPCIGTYGRRLESTEGGMFDVGHIEIYVSRQLSLFGTRCATVNTTLVIGPSVLLRCLEGMDSAQGRFVYIRSFDSARMLRIDGVKVYKNSGSRRQLLQEPVADEPEPEPDPEPEREEGTGEKAKSITDKNMKRLSENMYNLTKTVCYVRHTDADVALQTRMEAAILWAELDEKTSNKSCFDCISRVNRSCHDWFAQEFGLHSDAGPRAERIRQLKQRFQEDEPERRRKLEEALDGSCCRISRKTGKKECKKEFCDSVIKQHAQQRMGHILRRMNDAGHVKLSVVQQVAVDVVSPHIHVDPRCRSDGHDGTRKDSKISDTECIASSLISHIATKHGISKDKIDGELGKYGLSVAQMIAQPFKVASTAAKTSANFRSNPVFADMAANLKERQRTEGKPDRRVLHARPRGRALKDARTAVEETRDTVQAILPGAKGSAHGTRHAKNSMHSWLRNVSKFASDVHRSAEKSRMSSLMPQVHPSAQPSTMSSITDTVTAVVGSEGSVVNTVVHSAKSLGVIMERAGDVMNKISESEQKRKETSNEGRKLSESAISSFYDQVEARLAAKLQANPGRRMTTNEVGLTIPQEHLEQHGWITSALDWRKTIADTHTIAGRLLHRHDEMLAHIDRTGALPTGALPESQRTGIPLLDLNAPPSKVGNMFRELHSWLTNRHRTEPARKEHRRRMEDARSTPRQDRPDVQHSTLVAALGALVAGTDPIHAVKDSLETGNHHTRSRMRKLADSVLGVAASVPLMTTSIRNQYSNYPATEGGVDFFKEAARYLVYGNVMPF